MSLVDKIQHIINELDEMIGIMKCKYKWHLSQDHTKALYIVAASHTKREIGEDDIKVPQINGITDNDWIAVHVVYFYNQLIYFWTLLKINGYINYDDEINKQSFDYFFDGGLTLEQPKQCNINQYFDLQMNYFESFVNNKTIFPINKQTEYPINFKFMIQMLITRMTMFYVYFWKYHVSSFNELSQKLNDKNISYECIMDTFKHMVVFSYHFDFNIFKWGAKKVLQNCIMETVGIKYMKTKKFHQRINDRLNTE
eukprot:447700_1